MRTSLLALALVAIAGIVLAESTSDDSAPASEPKKDAAPKDEKSYLQMWIELDDTKKTRMAEYMKVRGGHPWRFVRCESCGVLIERFSAAIVEAGGCGESEGAKTPSENIAKPLCAELLKNESDILLDSCVKDYVTNCDALMKAVASAPTEGSRDPVTLCDGTEMCAKKPSKPPKEKKSEKKEDL